MVALLGSAVETQMQRIELKLSHLDEINTLIHQEREQVTPPSLPAAAAACHWSHHLIVGVCDGPTLAGSGGWPFRAVPPLVLALS